MATRACGRELTKPKAGCSQLRANCGLVSTGRSSIRKRLGSQISLTSKFSLRFWLTQQPLWRRNGPFCRGHGLSGIVTAPDDLAGPAWPPPIPREVSQPLQSSRTVWFTVRPRRWSQPLPPRFVTSAPSTDALLAAGVDRPLARQQVADRVQAIGHPDDGLWAVGVDDSHYYDCADLGAAVAGVPEGVFKLLLAHSPEMLRRQRLRTSISTSRATPMQARSGYHCLVRWLCMPIVRDLIPADIGSIPA
jgi:hypothetical protein